MNLYIDVQYDHWVGSPELGVMFLNTDNFRPGYEYETEVWSFQEAEEKWGLKLVES